MSGFANPSPSARPPFVYWTFLWIAGSLPACALFVHDFLSTKMGIRIGRDFTNMWTAGRMALNGDGAFAFDVNVFRLELLESVGILSLQNFSFRRTRCSSTRYSRAHPIGLD